LFEWSPECYPLGSMLILTELVGNAPFQENHGKSLQKKSLCLQMTATFSWKWSHRYVASPSDVAWPSGMLEAAFKICSCFTVSLLPSWHVLLSLVHRASCSLWLLLIASVFKLEIDLALMHSSVLFTSSSSWPSHS